MVKKLADQSGSSAMLGAIVLLALFAVDDAHGQVAVTSRSPAGQSAELGFLGIGNYETTVPAAYAGDVQHGRPITDVIARRPELCRLPPVTDEVRVADKPSEIPQPTTASSKATAAKEIPSAVVKELVNPAAAIGSYVGRWAAGGSRESATRLHPQTAP